MMSGKLTAAQKAKLQKMIDRTVAASNAFQTAQSELNEWCRDVYGFEPGDADVDGIIDAVFGGGGASRGMTAAEFHSEMESAS